ncbi:hypothetical protein K525DRAFT_268987 [Schizophyllum commune Loenen D]|nr:hypothetical protein K525DRAFT_268987 [Schizophyllum commune Loenen D]
MKGASTSAAGQTPATVALEAQPQETEAHQHDVAGRTSPGNSETEEDTRMATIRSVQAAFNLVDDPANPDADLNSPRKRIDSLIHQKTLEKEDIVDRGVQKLPSVHPEPRFAVKTEVLNFS